MHPSLKIQNELLVKIGQVADGLQLQAFAVGGYVRDRLLGKEVKDIDIVVIGDGPFFARKVAEFLQAKDIAIYKNFGTAMVRHQGHVFEFVGARKESYRSNSRKPEVESADLQTDLTRRDFAINAIAASLNQSHFGELVDPFDGAEDLQKKIIRTPLEPAKTFFDDPLRMLRAIRFATQLGFTIEENTLRGIAGERERLRIISQERITDELVKIMSFAKPSVGFKLMDSTGLLDIILPEISAMKGVDRIGKHGHKDVFLHSIQVVDNVAKKTPSLPLRFAALFHDVAKPLTKEFKPEIGWTFHGHDELGAKMLIDIGRRLRLSNETIRYVRKLVRLHLRPIHLAEEGVTDSAIRRLIRNAGADLDDLILLCRADITSGNPSRVATHLGNFDRLVERIQEVEEKDHLRQFQPPVRGEEIMAACGLEPGPLVGKIKKQIEEAILNGEIANEHDAAFEYMMQIKEEILGTGNFGET
jgi:poly(A) polymerase